MGARLKEHTELTDALMHFSGNGTEMLVDKVGKLVELDPSWNLRSAIWLFARNSRSARA